MNLSTFLFSKFFTYWALTFAILIIWGFSIAVALADVKDEFLVRLKKQGAAAARPQTRPADPSAGRSVAETLRPPAMTRNEAWLFDLVTQIAKTHKLDVKIIVLQDSMDHYLVHFIRGKQLVSYRVDKAWVADAMAGKTDQRERIQEAVGRYLRQEFFGEKLTPKTPAPPAKAPASSAPGQQPPAAAPGQARAAPPGAPPAAAPPSTAAPSAPAGPSAPAAPSTPAAPSAQAPPSAPEGGSNSPPS